MRSNHARGIVPPRACYDLRAASGGAKSPHPPHLTPLFVCNLQFQHLGRIKPLYPPLSKAFCWPRQCDGFFIWCCFQGGAGDEGERRKTECLENRNWKQTKVKLKAEASIAWMPQEFLKPSVLGVSHSQSGEHEWGSLQLASERRKYTLVSNGCPPPPHRDIGEGGGRTQNIPGFERNKGHFLTVYKIVFTVFPCLGRQTLRLCCGVQVSYLTSDSKK